MLSTKKGKDAWVEPVIEAGGYRFMVKTGAPEAKPDLGASEAGGAEVGVSEAGIPEASVSRNGALESGVPDAGAPGNSVSWKGTPFPEALRIKLGSIAGVMAPR